MLNASNFGIKGSPSAVSSNTADKVTTMQPETKHSSHSTLRTAHSSKLDGANKNLTSARQGRSKTRALQTQKSASARQVLENVLLKEMKATSSKSTSQEHFGDDVKPSDASGALVVDAKTNAAGSKNSASVFPSTNGLPTNPIANSNIREKLRQHHRQSAQAYNVTKQEDQKLHSEIDNDNSKIQ